MTSSYSKHTWCKDVLFIKSTHPTLTLCKEWQNTSNTATNICSYGEKSLDEDSEKGSFSKLAVQQMGHLPLFHPHTSPRKIVTFGNQVVLAACFFFVVVFKCCASLWGCHPTPRHSIMMARKSDTFTTMQSIKCTAFVLELLRRKQIHL